MLEGEGAAALASPALGQLPCRCDEHKNEQGGGCEQRKPLAAAQLLVHAGGDEDCRVDGAVGLAEGTAVARRRHLEERRAGGEEARRGEEEEARRRRGGEER